MKKIFSSWECNCDSCMGRKVIHTLEALKPKLATGIYITSHGVSFGFRTNKKNYPENFLPLWEAKKHATK